MFNTVPKNTAKYSMASFERFFIASCRYINDCDCPDVSQKSKDNSVSTDSQPIKASQFARQRFYILVLGRLVESRKFLKFFSRRFSGCSYRAVYNTSALFYRKPNFPLVKGAGSFTTVGSLRIMIE